MAGTMAHPGTIVYANPPGEDGWRFFVVVYHGSEDYYTLRCQTDEGELIELAGSAGEIFFALTREIAAANPGDGSIPLRAAEMIRDREGQ